MAYLKNLSISNLRNLRQVDWSCDPRINLIYGDNGSGKSSLLEAISILATGRSFRTHKSKALISDNADKLVLFSHSIIEDEKQYKLGIEKTRQGTNKLKLNGDIVTSASELAKSLPVRIIDPSVFRLIEGSPADRRAFNDWLVFHVKHEFHALWQMSQKIIKHRNVLLRHDKIDKLQLKILDRQLSDAANEMHVFRSDCFELFKTNIYALTNKLMSFEQFSVSYSPGWNTDVSLESVLEEEYVKDVRDGYTHKGPHRANLSIKVNNKPATDVLSRGQEKTLISLMHLAQAQCYSKFTGNQCVFLIDDMSSELDEKFQKYLADSLVDMGCQIFVTGINKEELTSVWQESLDKHMVSVFHVKHGELSNCKTPK